jgi:hypothetical protein
VLVWDATALTTQERADANNISLIASAAVDKNSTVARTPARTIVGLGDESDLNELLQRLTTSIKGLDDLKYKDKLRYNQSSTDPGVFSAAPFGAGGPCPTHQDYNPKDYGGSSRVVTFFLVLQDTTSQNGATYYFPGSRDVEKRERHAAPKPTRGRPRGRQARVRHEDGKVAAQHLDRDLEATFGRVVLAGPRLSIFRAEASNWHGAYANHGASLRSVVIWSYSTPNLVGVIGQEVH